MLKKLPLLLLAFIFNSCASQQSFSLIDEKLETKVKETLNYYLYYPPNYKIETNKKFPILLFLHGGGEIEPDDDKNKRIPPPKLILEGKDFPFIILAPQNSFAKKWWNTRAVKQLLDSVIVNNRVDTQRIYLSGISRGGGAAWEMAVQYPETFAAMAVVCGMTPVPYASWINRKMPIWVFHGEEDPVIPVQESEEMVEKLKSLGYDVKFTKYEGVGHNAWSRAYATEELYEWMISQKLGN
ncbi:PHB depolymerase family esterase [Maribacter sp. PR1]|uniref:PHB depolymerase family esterase n=1 Tax=Maribacter cobaltidurans TaxID=1178778 RepID=A0ABU7IW50_9FLAO|nr:MULTISPECIES: PHB depolymerase family esterase [Maribacter]MDC6389812.1 PHB depolymerase family esterase [Maribacter sp. PR1]MEE1977202.1 PHB depolymerase family esterase [Maribacter cobaltidurans]